jgi:hypothetical protein
LLALIDGRLCLALPHGAAAERDVPQAPGRAGYQGEEATVATTWPVTLPCSRQQEQGGGSEEDPCDEAEG